MINMNENPIPNETSYCSEEIKQWASMGLIPKELLEKSSHMELSTFIFANFKTLKNKLKKLNEENSCQITLPPQQEWDNSYELQVIDRRTGQVVKTLEKVEQLDLYDGISLTVKSKEIDEWKSEIGSAEKLTKEQSEELKTVIEKIGNNNPISRQDIVKIIQEIRKPKRPTKYRQSGHLVDEKLKYTMPTTPQTLFDLLAPEVKQKIEESKIEVKVEGIKLTPPQNKLVHALNLLLHEKSTNNKNIKEAGFYEGNMPNELVSYGIGSESKAPVLKFKPSELYKAYIGHNDYSGHDIHFINNELRQLEGQKVLIKYDRIKKVTKNKKTETLTDRIEDFQPLIKIISFIPDLTNEERERLDQGDSSIREKKGEIVIALNPIFTDQIDTKFIEFPVDTNRRLVIAAGGHNKVTSSMITLMEWMLREISNKRYKPEINEDKLPYILGLEKYLKQNRKKLLKGRIDKDIEAIKNVGIILLSEKVPNSIGGYKWIFHLNKDYE